MKIENNTYKQLYVDLTNKCNLRCPICYQGDNKYMKEKKWNIEDFNYVCQKLPSKVIFRFLGGEPTLHPNIDKIISISKRYGHIVSIVTNGIKISEDIDFLKRLKSIDPNILWGISMDGGLSDVESYKLINGKNILENKKKALENLLTTDFKRITIGSIILKNKNENVIKELLDLYDRCNKRIRYLHFRTMAKVGDYIDMEPYTVPELSKVVKNYLSPDVVIKKIVKDPIKCCGDCDFFTVDKMLQIGIIGFATEKSKKCWYRGKLVDKNNIETFFGEMCK